jgi:type I restriction enzyme S subunit
MTLHDDHERQGSWQDQGVAGKEAWTLKLLGDVCDFQRGLTYSKSDEVDISANVVLRATNIDLATNTLALDELKHIGDKTFVPDIKKVKNGSLMICMASGSKGHLGKVAYIDRDYGFAFGGFMGLITARENLLPRYLFHLMTSKGYKDFISGLSDGANINNLTFDKLRAFPIPVPPLPEQQRIVDLLDEVFAGLATAKANAERNLQNARAIFDSHLQSVFSQRRQGWEQRALGGLCSIARGGSPRPISEFLTTEPGGVNWIKISDATSSGKYIYRAAQSIRPEGAARSRMVNEGDFILSNSMSFGRPYIMRTSGCIHDGWLVLSDYSASLEQDYLYYVLGSQLVFRQFDRLAAGSTVRNLNIDLASRVVLPVPPLDIQRAIVQEVEALAEETQRLTRVYERKLAALDELKKTLLHKAFSGEL